MRVTSRHSGFHGAKNIKKEYYRPEIQGFRAVAVCLVILYHARFSIPYTLEFRGGFIGVDVFFTISGFVVGGLIFREISNGTFSARTFLLRRANRLLPALATVTGFSLVMSFFVIGVDRIEKIAQTGMWATVWSANLFLLADNAKYFESDSGTNPLVHTWSLSVEEQFYLFIAGLVALVIRFAPTLGRDPKRTLTFLATGLLILSFVHSQLVVTSDANVAFYLPSTRAWEFLAGFLLYILWERFQPTNWVRFLSFPAAFLGIATIFYGAVFYNERYTLFPGITAAVPVSGTVLLILAGLTDTTGFVRAVFGNPVIRFLGDVSYGWYLWHWPFVVFADLRWPDNDEMALAVSVAAILPAWLSSRYLESVHPTGLRSNRHQSVRPKLIAAIVIPFAMAFSLLGLEKLAFNQLKYEGSFLYTVKENRATIEAETQVPSKFSMSPEVLVIGDSHAVVIAKALAGYPHPETLEVGTVSEFKGCLFMIEPFPGRSSETCEQWQTRTLEEIRESRAETVVLHGYTTGRLTGIKRGNPAPIEIFSDDGTHLETASEALEAYEIGLTNWIRSITDSGKEVVLVTSVPDFSRPLPYDLPENRTPIFSVLKKSNPQISYESIEVIPLGEALQRNSAVLGAEVAASRDFTQVRVLDLSPLICELGDCRQWREGRLVYIDLDHLSSAFAAEVIAPFLHEQLRKE